MDADNEGESPSKRPRVTPATVEDVMFIARRIWGKDNPHERSTAQQEDRDFRETFGKGPLTIHSTWCMLVHHNLVPENGELEHLLWTAMFCKQYGKKRQLMTACKADYKTIMKYAWAFIDAIADMESILITWNNRFRKDRGADCLISVDCVDFRIPQRGAAFASHKFKKKSGLRYEIGICIQTGDVVWVNGPYPCGRNPDITIFRDFLMHHLEPNERAEADDGYVGETPQHAKCPASFTNLEITEYMQQRVRSRQETINKRCKDWEILKTHNYKHSIVRHGDVVRAILCVEQVAINQGEQLFETGYCTRILHMQSTIVLGRTQAGNADTTTPITPTLTTTTTKTNACQTAINNK